MEKLKLRIDEKFETKELIKKEINLDSDIKKNLVTKTFKSSSKTVYFYMYEEYFMRTNSELTVTIFVLETPDFTEIELMSSGGGVGFSFARDDNRQTAWDIRTGIKTSIGNPSWKQTTYDVSVIWKDAGKKRRPKAFMGLGFRYMDSHTDGIPNLSIFYATVGCYL